MEKTIIPQNYHSELNLHDTQIAIKTVKDFFESLIAERLHLARVSAPLFVDPKSGLNDNLNGVERPVGKFDIKEQTDVKQKLYSPLQMETLRIKEVRFFLWRRSLHGHECHPPR